MSAINESRGVFDPSEAAAIEYRVKEGVIEFATRESFDRRESALVSYNITHLIESGVDLEEVRKAITSFVDPEEWEDNGGNLGTMMIVGNRMFVKAPPRMQEGVKWFIEQLAGQDGAPAAAGERAPAAALPAERNNLVYVSGLVDRPGPYNHPGDELTLRRVLISASIKPDAEEATVVRGPAEQPMTIGTLRGADLFDPTGADFEIRPGDIVTVK
jgi:hypothetical protein